MELLAWSSWWQKRGADGIRRILMDEWDPIGLREIPQAAHQYDRYGRVVGLLLLRGTVSSAIENYLRQVRTHYMLLGPGMIGGQEGEERARDSERRVVTTLATWYAAESSAVG
jgi:hypothetical protein